MTKPKVIEADPTKVPIGHGLFACHLLDAMNLMSVIADVMLQNPEEAGTAEIVAKLDEMTDNFEACLHNAGGAYLEEHGDSKEL